MTLVAGTIETLTVVREAEFGYFLSDGVESILLHRSEIEGEIALEDEIEVFLYQDHEGRLAASMTIPDVTLDDYDWVEVVGVQEKFGVFVNIGIGKDMLVSSDDLPLFKSVWPAVGDVLYCALKLDRKDRLYGYLATEDIMRESANLAVIGENVKLNADVRGRIYRAMKIGSMMITDEGFVCFIHNSERKEEPRLGQLVEGRIIDVKEDGTLNISLLPRKQEAMDDDSKTIVTYMENRNGAMPYFDKSDSEEIRIQFNMSKAAFKRALGRLMKEGKVYQKEGWTYFKEETNLSESTDV